jgi:hypothetical protein
MAGLGIGDVWTGIKNKASEANEALKGASKELFKTVEGATGGEWFPKGKPNVFGAIPRDKVAEADKRVNGGGK